MRCSGREALFLKPANRTWITFATKIADVPVFCLPVCDVVLSLTTRSRAASDCSAYPDIHIMATSEAAHTRFSSPLRGTSTQRASTGEHIFHSRCPYAAYTIAVNTCAAHQLFSRCRDWCAACAPRPSLSAHQASPASGSTGSLWATASPYAEERGRRRVMGRYKALGRAGMKGG